MLQARKIPMGCVGTINRHQLGNRVRVLSTSKIIPAEDTSSKCGAKS